MSSTKNNLATCFQLKADFVPITVLKLTSCDLATIEEELDNTINQAPNYFTNAPIVIDTHAIAQFITQLDFAKLCQILRDKQMIPIGIRGLQSKHKLLATQHNLAILNSAKQIKPLADNDSKTNPESKATAPPAQSKTPAHHKTKLLTKAIRAGSQIYAKDSDLVITSAVNAGAECIADGNIHIYGPLRGRALAGANGNVKARIFCQSLEAELISIAGHYLVNEDIQSPKKQPTMIQIYLKDQKLHIEGI